VLCEQKFWSKDALEVGGNRYIISMQQQSEVGGMGLSLEPIW